MNRLETIKGGALDTPWLDVAAIDVAPAIGLVVEVFDHQTLGLSLGTECDAVAYERLDYVTVERLRDVLNTWLVTRPST